MYIGTEVKLKLVDLSDLESDDSSEDSTEHSMKEEQETDSMRSKKIDMKVSDSESAWKLYIMEGN